MPYKKHIAIIGATSAIAEHCARNWVQEEVCELFLVGRNETHLEHIANDLQVRSPNSKIHTLQTDFLDPSAIQSLIKAIYTHGVLDIVLIAHGTLPDQANCQQELELCRKTLEINGISPVLFAEAFAAKMAVHNHGTLALISSVAGDRGRKSNYVYGSAKGLITRYAQGLQHRFADSQVKVVLIKPGPTDTPMTAHLKEGRTKLASADQVAKEIINAIENGTPIVYTPRKWMLIMWIIRHLPRTVFNQLDI